MELLIKTVVNLANTIDVWLLRNVSIFIFEETVVNPFNVINLFAK